ncbi:9074_t:CDS:2 [Gigaspora rosea]|nr:9074_t:CDS:2 [Gigaspora rosea]
MEPSEINQNSDTSNNQSSEIQIESSGINQESDTSDNQSTEIQIESDASYIQCFTPCCPTHKIKIQNCPLKEDLFIYHIIDFSIFYNDPNNININYAQGRDSQDPYGSPLSIANISCIARYMNVTTFHNFSCTEYIQNSPEVDKYWIFSPFKYAYRNDLYDSNLTGVTGIESIPEIDFFNSSDTNTPRTLCHSEFTIRIRTYSSLYLGQFGLYPEQVAFLDIETKSSLQIINGTYTILNLSPSMNPIVHERDQYQNTFGSVISYVGGLISSISIIIAFIFVYPFCRPINRGFKYDFIRRHKLLEVEIPFVEPLKEIKDDPSNLAKKVVKRLNMIEELLRDYYIDTSYFEKIKRITDKYK